VPSRVDDAFPATRDELFGSVGRTVARSHRSVRSVKDAPGLPDHRGVNHSSALPLHDTAAVAGPGFGGRDERSRVSQFGGRRAEHLGSDPDLLRMDRRAAQKRSASQLRRLARAAALWSAVTESSRSTMTTSAPE
jgi:hypothetical protein